MNINEWIEKFEKAGVTDLDAEVHELKSIEASDINNGGLGEQLQYLLDQCGEDYLKNLIGEEGS